MQLAELMAYRTVPGSVVFLSLTQRCPLRCRHCCTDSLMSSQQHDEEIFRNFVDTFTPQDHPEVVYMTGGEALLRPRLVQWIAERAREVGTRSALISGMYFARNRSMPPMVRAAIMAVDHFVASLDEFHEERVSRAAVLTVLRDLIDAGRHVSLQVVGRDDDDPYLGQVTADAVEATSGRMPILVTTLTPVGRARDLMGDVHTPAFTRTNAQAMPCLMAGWPVVSYDGTVIACCNQEAIDRKGPEHLVLGSAVRDGWASVRDRALTDPITRVLRTLGPEVVAEKAGGSLGESFCRTCIGLAGTPGALSLAATMADEPSFAAMETVVTDIVARRGFDLVLQRHASTRYGHLAQLDSVNPVSVTERASTR